MQPTARSTPQRSSSTGTDPAEWQRSHSDEGARVVDDGGDRLDVGQVARAVRDLAEHHDRGPLPHGRADLVDGDAGLAVDVDPAHGQAPLGGDALDDVAVGGEVVGVDDDLVAARPGVDRGPDQLVEQHRRRVADGRLAGGGTEADPGDSSPRVSGRSYQRSSQPRIRRPPHSASTKARSRAPVTASGRPSELPSKYTRGVVGADELGAEAGQRVGGVEGRGVLRGGVDGGVVGHGGSLTDLPADQVRCRPRCAREASPQGV